MRVAINALAVSPTRPGGDATYVRELVRHLPAAGRADDEFVVFIGNDAQSLFPPVPQVRYVTCPIPARRIGPRVLWEQVGLPNWIRKVHPDIVHAPVNVAPLVVTDPLLLTVHEVYAFMPDNGIPLPLLAWWKVMRRASVRRARALLTVSQSALDDMVRVLRVRADRVHVTLLGVDLKRFTREGDRTRLDVPYIFWAGRPYPSKNLSRLVDAFALLRARGRRERLVLAGPPGWADADLAAQIRRLGLGNAVLRHPSLDAELPAWYRGAAVVAYPSLRETYGLPLLEAMACGAPVVTSAIPALRETAGDAAIFCDPLEPASIADALEQALDDQLLRAELRERGYERSAAATWQRTADATYARYAAVCC